MRQQLWGTTVFGIIFLVVMKSSLASYSMSSRKRRDESNNAHEKIKGLERAAADKPRELGFFINGGTPSRTISGNPATTAGWASVKRERGEPVYAVGKVTKSARSGRTDRRHAAPLPQEPVQQSSLPHINRNRDPAARWVRKRWDTIRTNIPVTNAPTGAPTQVPTAAPTSTQRESVLGVIEADNNLTVLSALLNMSGLVSALQGNGPFTVFAPSDMAFDSVPNGTVNLIMADNNSLRSVLLYHVVPGIIFSWEIQNGTLRTLEGSNLTTFVEGSNIRINDANITDPDMFAGNGIVHIIDAVLLPDITSTVPPTNPTTVAPTAAPTSLGSTLAPTVPGATNAPTTAGTTAAPTTSGTTVAPTTAPTTAAAANLQVRTGVGLEFSDKTVPLVQCVGSEAQDIAFGIDINVDRPPGYKFEECSKEQLESIEKVIETTLNMAFPYTVPNWPGHVIFKDFEFDQDQFIQNASRRRQRHLLRRDQHDRPRQIQEITACPNRPNICQDTADACLFGCGIATIQDCGDFQSWHSLETVLSTSLSALSLPCLSHPAIPGVTLSILPL